MLARYSSNPARVHWKALKRILVYMYHTKDRPLTFGRHKGELSPIPGSKSSSTNAETPLVTYVDADHAGCKDSAKSTSGTVITMFGGTIYCKSKKQGKVSNSTGMAELYAVANMARKAEHYLQVYDDISGHRSKIHHQKYMPIHTDSNVVVKMIERGYLSSDTKHLRIAFHEVKDAVSDGTIKLYHIPGEDNPADIVTKSLPRVTHEKHADFLLQDK